MAMTKKSSKKAGSGARRSPSAAPRPAARAAPVGEPGVPIFIRSVDAPMTPEDRDYVRKKLAARLARYGTRIERASVRIEDVNGPRGGIDTRCRIKVVLSGMPSVAIEEQQRVLRAAIDGALGRIAAAMRRGVERRETPVHRARRASVSE